MFLARSRVRQDVQRLQDGHAGGKHAAKGPPEADPLAGLGGRDAWYDKTAVLDSLDDPAHDDIQHAAGFARAYHRADGSGEDAFMRRHGFRQCTPGAYLLDQRFCHILERGAREGALRFCERLDKGLP